MFEAVTLKLSVHASSNSVSYSTRAFCLSLQLFLNHLDTKYAQMVDFRRDDIVTGNLCVHDDALHCLFSLSII